MMSGEEFVRGWVNEAGGPPPAGAPGTGTFFPGTEPPVDGTLKTNRETFVPMLRQDDVPLRPLHCRCRYRALLWVWRLMQYVYSYRRPQSGTTPSRLGRFYRDDHVAEDQQYLYAETKLSFCCRACRDAVQAFVHAVELAFLPSQHMLDLGEELFRFVGFLDYTPEFEGINGAGRFEAAIAFVGSVCSLMTPATRVRFEYAHLQPTFARSMLASRRYGRVLGAAATFLGIELEASFRFRRFPLRGEISRGTGTTLLVGPPGPTVLLLTVDRHSSPGISGHRALIRSSTDLDVVIRQPFPAIGARDLPLLPAPAADPGRAVRERRPSHGRRRGRSRSSARRSRQPVAVHFEVDQDAVRGHRSRPSSPVRSPWTSLPGTPRSASPTTPLPGYTSRRGSSSGAGAPAPALDWADELLQIFSADEAEATAAIMAARSNRLAGRPRDSF